MQDWKGEKLMFDKKILIVDDEIDILEPFCDYLSLKGFKNILGAVTASEALEKIEKEKPDLVLLDIELNESINGMEILRRTREELSPGSKIVMISGYKDEYEADSYRLGANEFWKKPILPRQVLEKIIKILSEK